MNLDHPVSLDESLEKVVKNLDDSVSKIENILKIGLDFDNYKDLNLNDKINYDLFIGYTLNTLYWIYLRTQGIDPNKNDVKNELKRVKDYMLKAKQVIHYFSKLMLLSSSKNCILFI